MKVFIELVKIDIPFAIYEAMSLLKFNSYQINDNLILSEIKNDSLKYLQRLAYSRNVSEVIWQSEIGKIKSKLDTYDFSNDVKGSYKISFVNLEDQELIKKVYRSVWLTLKSPKVDLKNPQTEIVFVKFNDFIFLCKKITEIYQDYKARLPNKRDGFRPISLHPRLARSLVNMTGVRDGRGDVLVDPFCGIGGIPIEALLMNVKCEAYDFDDVMVRISEHNFKKFGFSENMYKAKNRDFFKSNRKINFLAGDLPYGKNTRDVTSDFYEKVLLHLSKILGNRARAVLIFPHWIDVEQIITKRKIKLSIKAKFIHFVHKSMSRIVFVFEKK